MKFNLLKRNAHKTVGLVIMVLITSCKKLVEIPQPINSITTEKAFDTDAGAKSAVNGIYLQLSYNTNNPDYANSSLSAFTGCSSDELVSTSSGSDATDFQLNNLLESNYFVLSNFWIPAYSTIYQCNAVLEGLDASSGVSSQVKQQLKGEVLFLRAYSYFYLINLFGDVPLVTSTSFKTNALLSRSPVSSVYDQILVDLKSSQNFLPVNFSILDGESSRIYANKYAATALLARVYLYLGLWSDAEVQASTVINDTKDLELLSDLNSIFLKNSKESIWQLEVVDRYPYATLEADSFIPSDSNSIPKYNLTSVLLNSFEAGDKRKIAWVGNSKVSTNFYYYPQKYKVKNGTSGNITEYYTLLRLSEQYLIRAEARANQGKLTDAISDLNVIRKRASLSDLPSLLNKTDVLTAVAQENKIEFFAEMGHRWLDLKRTKTANDVLGPFKGSNWQSTDQLFPIPASERSVNPNLTQNPGY